MKTKQLLLSFMAVAILGGLSIFLLNDVNDGNSLVNKYKERSGLTANESDYSARGAAEWLSERRVNPATGTISRKDLELAKKSVNQSEQNKNVAADNMNWQFIGPDDVGGRTRAFLIDNRDNTTLWAGGVAGGIWKSTTGGQSWVSVDLDDMGNIAISAMCQDSEGNIYVGTGEYFAGLSGINSTSTGFTGAGIWKSSDGITFDVLPSTDNASSFDYVNELIIDPATNNLYAATNAGLFKSTNKGDSWETLSTKSNVVDVKIANNNTVVFSTASNIYTIKNGGSEYTVPGLDAGFNRIELAVAPSDLDYVYAFCSYYQYDKYFQLYQSKDAGETWEALVTQQSSSINPFGSNSQGSYDNIIKVYPDDPGKVIMGGVDLWTWSEANAFEQVSFWMEFADAKYVHADQHNIVFHPDYLNNHTVYFTNDGGVFGSYDGAVSFTSLDKNYGVTQYYGIDCGPKGEILGGCQDNGSPYLDMLDNDKKSSWSVSGGDGGYTAISELYPGAVFSTLYYANLFRSNENGVAMTANPWSGGMNDAIEPGNHANPFITPIDMWESFDYDSSKIYIPFVVDTVIEIKANGVPDTVVSFDEGYTFLVQSSVVNPRKFEYTVTAEDISKNQGNPLTPGDTIAVREKFASLMAIGVTGIGDGVDKLFITREILNFKTEEPQWDAVAGQASNINANLNIKKVYYVKWAPDGNSLYALAKYGNNRNGFFRFTNIKDAYHYSGPTYQNRVITLDTTLNLSKHIYTECDTTYINNIVNTDVASIVNASDDYNDYSLDAGSMNYTNIFNIDSTISATDTLINITYKDLTSGCNVQTVNGINIDTITNFQTQVVTFNSLTVTLANSTFYNNIVKIDTVVTPDTTYQMGVMGSDMVWRNTDVNTINQVSGSLIKNFAGTVPTSVAVDPKDTKRVVVTVGGYGSQVHAWYWNDIDTDPNGAESIIGTGLPLSPIYSSLFSDTTAVGEDLLLLGTEYGIYTTTNIDGANTQWVRQTSIPKVPVFQMVQQGHVNGYMPGVGETGIRNSGIIYAGTHGLGVWQMDLYKRPYTGIEELQAEKVDALSVKVYPNPVKYMATIEYQISKASEVEISVYSLTGKLVYTQKIFRQKGLYTQKVNAESLSKGVYLVSLTSDKERKVSKFIVE